MIPPLRPPPLPSLSSTIREVLTSPRISSLRYVSVDTHGVGVGEVGFGLLWRFIITDVLLFHSGLSLVTPLLTVSLSLVTCSEKQLTYSGLALGIAFLQCINFWIRVSYHDLPIVTYYNDLPLVNQFRSGLPPSAVITVTSL